MVDWYYSSHATYEPYLFLSFGFFRCLGVASCYMLARLKCCWLSLFHLINQLCAFNLVVYQLFSLRVDDGCLHFYLEIISDYKFVGINVVSILEA